MDKEKIVPNHNSNLTEINLLNQHFNMNNVDNSKFFSTNYQDASKKTTNDRNGTPIKSSMFLSSQLETSALQEAFKNSSAWSESVYSNRNSPSVNLVHQTVALLLTPSMGLSQISQTPFSKVASKSFENKMEKEAIHKKMVEQSINQYLENQKIQQGW